MTKSLKYCFLFFLFLNLGCMHRKHNHDSENHDKETKEQYPQAEIGVFSDKNDSYTLISVKIVGNFMELEVSYAGGCEQHEFRLIGSTDLGKSIPPVRNIQLAHNNKGDKCKAIVQEKLKFSISNLASSTDKGNKIMLQLENSSTALAYSYE